MKVNTPWWLRQIGRFLRYIPDFKGKRFITFYFCKIIKIPPTFYDYLTVEFDSIEPSSDYQDYNFQCSLKSKNKELYAGSLLDTISSHVFFFGIYESYRGSPGDLMLKSIKSNMVIFDIGANTGYYTIQFASKVSRNGKVYSFEPFEVNLKYLKNNISLNNYNNVVIVNKACSDSNNELPIYLNYPRNKGASSLYQSYQGAFSQIIQTIRIDDFIAKENIERVDLIKMDIEGHELSALKGMKNLLRQDNAPVLFIELNQDALSKASVKIEDVVDYLKSFDYEAFKYSSGKLQAYDLTSQSLVIFQKKNN